MIEAKASVCEEPFGTDEILSYTDKYVGNSKTKGGSKSQGMATLQRKVPAEISEEMTKKIGRNSKYKFRI